MKNMIKKALSVVAAGGMLSLAVVSSVSAHGISASDGSATNGADSSCFIGSFGNRTNNCGTTKNFQVALMVDSGGSKGATFTGKNLTCQLVGMDQFGTSQSFSTTPSIGAGVSSASTSTVIVATAGKLIIACDILPGGQLINVNYSN